MEQLIQDLKKGEDVRLDGSRVFLGEGDVPMTSETIIDESNLSDVVCLTY